ncbi:unnamed protein product [Paramecium octaurelia]|uniref:Uncharacterized protein n=1 Tax=Paramecium octaurelia TaxID=43137 RepID=A0A8S1XDY4_PAROT|nr:unnamed protein product [Paramecium octaurelia]
MNIVLLKYTKQELSQREYRPSVTVQAERERILDQFEKISLYLQSKYYSNLENQQLVIKVSFDGLFNIYEQNEIIQIDKIKIGLQKQFQPKNRMIISFLELKGNSYFRGVDLELIFNQKPYEISKLRQYTEVVEGILRKFQNPLYCHPIILVLSVFLLSYLEEGYEIIGL